MKRRAVLIAILFGCLIPAHAAAAEWHSEQPVSEGLGVPTPLGPVGDIQCWQANRCLLITQGNEANPAGLYAYDGTGWHLYSEVCGGHEGRIAWAGPDDFWTISDQRVGQETEGQNEGVFYRRSLCHFVAGKVVASYAEPIGLASSYLQMNAAACAGPSDCWFGGERLPGTTNVGAFHLHWNGSALTAIPSLTEPQPSLLDPGRKVTSLAYHGGRYYESVEPEEGDMPVSGETLNQPALVHRVTTSSFPSVSTPMEYPEGVGPTQVEGLHFGGDAESLWAAAGAKDGAAAPILVFRLQGSSFARLTLQDPNSVLATGDRVTGIAPEPGSESAWLGFGLAQEEGPTNSPARLARIAADGEITERIQLPTTAEGAEGLGRKGLAGPVVCPAAGQCWMATSQGWLFHLGGPLPQDPDPYMHVLITSRPEDNGQPSVPAAELPEDNSDSELPPEEQSPLPFEKPLHPKPARTLVSGVKQKVVDRTLLVLHFTLHARAHVQLLAKQGKKVVAKTKRYQMGKGRHHVKLRLDPKHWPTHLAFEVHPLHSRKSKASSLTDADAAAFLGSIAVPSMANLTAAGQAEPIASLDDQTSAATATATATASAVAPSATATTGSPVAEAVLGTPGVMFIGTSSAEAAGEVWGVGRRALYRYAEGIGWEAQPEPTAPAGGSSSGFSGYETEFPGAGSTTPAGGVAAFARSASESPALVVRDPGGVPQLASEPGAALLSGESLYRQGSAGTPDPLAAFEAAAGGTGVFVAPAVNSVTPLTAVLRYQADGWNREPICLSEAGEPCTTPSEVGFEAVAIDATSETNAWLLARGPEVGIVLLHRGAGAWVEQPLEGPLGELFDAKEVEVGTTKVTVVPRRVGQPLTVTTAGVWVDAELESEGTRSEATMYLNSVAGDPQQGQVTASWCELTAATPATKLCTFPLGSELSVGAGRSFAWPPDGGAADPYGTRVVTGVGQGAILTLDGSIFSHQPLLGGNVGTRGGAALQSPSEGWLGSQSSGFESRPVRLTPDPHPSSLLTWPVPFQHPLTAIAAQPEAPSGAIGSQALAVGAEGEVARYEPGVGWQPEALLNGSGARVSPTLRGVAWPEPGFAYAVGDNGEMWMWRKGTGLWESDPGRPPNLIRGNFTAIAFDPSEPERGYAIGQQGLLLGYGKQWTQEELPAGVSPEANFSSISFAGDEALVTFSYPTSANTRAGGLLVNSGSGWKIEEAAQSALAGAIPTFVAGLSDGGAVVSTAAGILLERQGVGQPWQVASTTASGISALAAIREGGAVRAIVIAGEQIGSAQEEAFSCPNASLPECEQVEQQPAPGQPPLAIKPGFLSGGYLLRQSGSGWIDEEHQLYPLPAPDPSEEYDRPGTPDRLAALLVNPEGTQGWAVGGETGGMGGIETATVARYPADVASPNQSTAAIPGAGEGEATIAIGGNDQCAAPCADTNHSGIGPDVWLPHAISTAAGISGVRAFVYTGPGVAAGAASELSATAFAREEDAYAERLAPQGGLPVYAAPAESDRDRLASLATFTAAMGEHVVSSSGHPYYSFVSTGSGGTIRMIVLDYSLPTLGAEQDCWLAQELETAGAESQPAIVIGNRDLDPAGGSPTAAADSTEVTPIVVTGAPPSGCPAVGPSTGASAYFFDYPEQNRTYQLSANGKSIPSFGSGTLGYTRPQEELETDYVGASGFLVATVNVAQRNSATNVAPVTARLTPNISELALNALDGTLLRRSHQALFEALARRPRAGIRCVNEHLEGPSGCGIGSPDPYVPIPTRCQGARCGSGLFPEYRFTSSHPGVANFVAADPRSLNPRSVLLQNGKPVADPTSALLCAFNAGETTVTVESGGLAYSVEVTVQAGSVQQPCGTVPVENPPTRPAQVSPPPFPPSPAPNPGFKPVPTLPPTPPAPTVVQPPAVVSPHIPAVVKPPTPPTQAQPPPFFATSPGIAAIVPIVPPPPPPAVEPTPPSGTSPVTQPAFSPEPEKEEEAAFGLVHHAVANRPAPRRAAALAAYQFGSGGGHGPALIYGFPALILVAALSTCGIAGRRRRRAPEPAFLQSRR
jgi:hypothetical protein